MHTLVISDTHLSLPFEQSRFDKLKSIIEASHAVILNGDFWEGYYITFDEFCNSPWNKLFPLLKSKKTVYVFGNHDKKEFSDSRIYEFCDHAVMRHATVIGGNTFIFEHGNRIMYKIDDKLGIKRPNRYGFIILDKLQGLFIKLFGPHGFKILFGKLNQEGKDALKHELSERPNHIVVCGHTHCQEIDLKSKFINGGFFKHGWAEYLTLDHDGNVKLHSERYRK